MFTGDSIPAEYGFSNFKYDNKEGHIVDYGVAISAESDMEAKLQRSASNKLQAYCVDKNTVHFYRLVSSRRTNCR